MSEFLEQREIGRSGLKTSRLGIGSTFNASAQVIEDAFHRGVNYLYWGTVRQPDFAKAMLNLSKNHRTNFRVDDSVLFQRPQQSSQKSISASESQAKLLRLFLLRQSLQKTALRLSGQYSNVIARSPSEIFSLTPQSTRCCLAFLKTMRKGFAIY